jgi:hypothetical protein
MAIVIAFLFAALLVAPVTPGAAQEACRLIYPARNGWAIELCPTDPAVPTPMAVNINGGNVGSAARVAVYHVSGRGSMPQVAVLYATGFVRLKQNQDPPGAPIPFGASAVLGPAYWPNANTYYHNPQVQTLRITTAALPSRLDLQATGQNHAFRVGFQMQLPAPSDVRTRFRVVQTVTATTRVTIDPTRTNRREGFKTAAQLSSMYINEGGVCDGGKRDCHDSDASRYVANNGAQRLAAFRNLTPSTFVYSPTRPLGGRWLDALHRDDASWQGNTPSVRICIDALPAGRAFTPQGFITATTNPNDDNVGLWVQDDYRAAVGWTAGEQEVTRYWLVAQDDLLTSDPQRCW